MRGGGLLARRTRGLATHSHHTSFCVAGVRRRRRRRRAVWRGRSGRQMRFCGAGLGPRSHRPSGLSGRARYAQVGFSSRLAYARNNCRSAQAESGRLKIPWRNEPVLQQLLLANWLVSTRARKDHGRAGSRKRQVGSLAGQSQRL